MNFDPLRRLHSKLSIAFVAAAALVLASCGGGGATSSPTTSGGLQLLPSTSSLYAGVPYTFNIVGGRKPYLVTSSEQTIVQLNFTLDGNQFSVVPRNPGVVDPNLQPGEVPRRTVNIEVRDSVGATVSNAYAVLQNFFTGYNETYFSTCAKPQTGDAPPACSGTDTIVTLVPVSNGALYGDREFQFDKVRGDYSFVIENPAGTPQLVNQVRVRTDHTGKVSARIRVINFASTQLATFKVTDVLTGASTDLVFLIAQAPPIDAITLVPSSITFTGGLTTECGGGTADIFVFGGTPPYTVTAPSGIGFSPSIVTSEGGVFTITVSGGGGGSSPGSVPACFTGVPVVVTDSRGSRALETVNSAVGTGTVPPLTVAPTTVASLLCGQSAQVTVVGGAGGYSTNSQHPGITARVSGTTLTITRRATDTTPPPPYPLSGSVTVTDGATIATINITATPATCP